MTISKPAHRIILNGFRYAEPIWQLECLHDNNDPEWHTYYSEHAINHGQQYHHEECVAIKFWNKEGAELIVDTNNFLAVPFDVDAKWVMDDLKLVPRTRTSLQPTSSPRSSPSSPRSSRYSALPTSPARFWL